MASGALVEGTRVGPYALTRQLAVGGMASVWEARHQTSGALVALKVLHWQYAGDDRIVGRFLDEARLGVLLHHPNVVRTLDVGRDGPNLVYLALELLDGASLAEVVQANPKGLPYPAVVALGAQAADALAYAHQFRREDGAPLKLVHRDVKPSNLVLTVEGALKVIDFGIARVQWETKGQTQTGSFLGSLAYSAPEQVNELEVTAVSDVFSLGAVLHELLTGAQVFGRTSQAATVRAVSWSPAPPVRSVRPDVPKALEDCVLRALEKKPEARFASAAELAQALRESRGAEAPWGPEQLAALARVPKRAVVVASGTQSLPPGQPAAAQPAERHTTELPPDRTRELPVEPRGVNPAPARGRPAVALLLGVIVVVVLAGAAQLIRAPWLAEREPPPTPEPTRQLAAGPPDAAERPPPEPVEATEPAGEPQVAEPPTRSTGGVKRPKQDTGLGWLTVDAKRSWGQVRLNGKSVGPTPVYRHPLAPGRWKVDVDRPDGTHQTRTVTVRAGVEQVVMFDL